MNGIFNKHMVYLVSCQDTVLVGVSLFGWRTWCFRLAYLAFWLVYSFDGMLYLSFRVAYFLFILADFFIGMTYLVLKAFGMVYLLHEMER